METSKNVKQVVPFFSVMNMARSMQYYVDGLGFEMKKHWIDKGKLRWCWLELGGAALMLQEVSGEGHDSWTPKGIVGEGVSLYFICLDALVIYREARSRGIQAETPFVGNGMWVTGVTDPEGYRLYFESVTDTVEGTIYNEAERDA